MRILALAAVLALAAGACAAPPEVMKELREAATEAASAIERERSDAASPDHGAQTPPGGDEGGAARPGGAGGRGGDGGGRAGGERVEVRDDGPVGANGRALLRASHPRLVIEVDVQQGVEPDPAAVDHLIGVVRSVSDKPAGVTTAGGNTFASDREIWTGAALRDVARRHRSHRSDEDTVAVHLLYLRGRFERGDAIGVAHSASQVAVFPERWQGTLDALLGGGREVEESVLVHELGHLYGLVNLTYESRFDHESRDHPGHSRSRDSVMYWAVETTAVGQVFSGPPPDDFDRFDRADLSFLRTGRW